MRHFNRFYTNLIGLLNHHIYESPYSLTEVRVLYEINNNENVTARGIMETISIDEAYLSRILLKFQKLKLLRKDQSKTDKRVYYISPTEKGRSESRRGSLLNMVVVRTSGDTPMAFMSPRKFGLSGRLKLMP